MPEPTPNPSQVTRRAMLTLLATGATGVLAACAVAPAVAAAPTPTFTPKPKPSPTPSASTSAPAPNAGMTAPAATSTQGDAVTRAAWSVGLPRAGSPWEQRSPTGSWNTAFVMWLLYPDATGAPPSLADLRAGAIAQDRIGATPRPGAVVLHESTVPGDISHIGIVESVTSLAIMTIEGDVPGPIPSDQTFVRRYSRPLSTRLSYYYPDYGS